MRRSLQIATVLLTTTLGALTLFAQGQSHHRGGGQNTGGRSTGGATGTPQATTGTQSGHRAWSTQPSPGYVSPFQQQTHLPGGGTGCYNCGYGVYGGYVYTGYTGNYNPVGPTTTDRILANGGTFNNINQSTETQETAPQQQPQPMYIRPEYPTQYPADNGSVNTPLQGNVASASSDSPAILIFKDGTNLTIHNYAIYGTSIVVLTPERKKFPIAALDIPATQKANEAAGYELKLPAVFTSH